MEEKKMEEEDELPLPSAIHGSGRYLPDSVVRAGPSVSFGLGPTSKESLEDEDEDEVRELAPVKSGKSLASLIAAEGGESVIKKSSRSFFRREKSEKSVKAITSTPSVQGFTEVSEENDQTNQQLVRDISNARIVAKKKPIDRELTQRFIDRSKSTFRPTKYLDTTTNETILATTNKFLDPKRYRKLDDQGDVEMTQNPEIGGNIEGIGTEEITIDNLRSYNEIGFLGHVWRKVLQWLVRLTQDKTNALRLTRSLQLQMPFLPSYESFVLCEVISAFDSADRRKLAKALSVAFSCRNVSRILVQQMARYDFIWHQNHQFKYNRWYDGFGRVAIIGRTGFPVSENFPNTRNHAIASFFRVALGQGFWWTRVLTGRQGLQTDDANFIAQNLAAEAAGFETANRNQLGSYFGRERTNAFRLSQRLPTDESVVRTFIGTPLSTMLNNGVEHTLWALAKHWHNMLYQPYGNFAHQRMELLNPFEMMRFHMPVVCVVLSTLRGLSWWDSEVLAPFVEKLQLVGNEEDISNLKDLVQEMKDNIVVDLCGGVASRVDLLRSLLNAVDEALTALGVEAEIVLGIVQSVQSGISVGMDFITTTRWDVPSDSELLHAVKTVCKSEVGTIVDDIVVSPHAVRKALNLLSPKDMRTLIELTKQGYGNSKPAMLLARRTVTLLQREIRRDAMDFTIRQMSQGSPVEKKEYQVGSYYWLLDGTPASGVYIYDGKVTGKEIYRFHHMASKAVREITVADQVEVLDYVEIAELISRAQHAFMDIELDHLKKFSYDAFMELDYLREPLRQLMALSVTQCPELDEARMNVLDTIKSGFKTDVAVKDMIAGETYFYLSPEQKYEPFTPTRDFSEDDAQFEPCRGRRNVSCPPQNLIVIGGGPTGLLTALHCCENVLRSQGLLILYESRDAFAQGGATFERSQIVRLDSRWINMLRYHLGTVYEDEFVPASGETDPHFGNTLPTQGFIEITIKDMEAIMNLQVAKLASRDLIRHDTNAGCQYDVESNTLSKKGSALKVGDLIRRNYDASGLRTAEEFSWRVTELVSSTPISADALELGNIYGVFDVKKRSVGQFELVGTHLKKGEYIFASVDDSHDDIICNAKKMPPIYPKGTKVKDDVEAIKVECVLRDKESGTIAEETLPYKKIHDQKFLLDIGHFHVAEAIGKRPSSSKVHFEITTEEPYGVACLSGLKVSMGMHNLGTRRWQNGLVDDIRSHTDQNTRVIGDFTKTVNAEMIVEKMVEFIKTDIDWKLNLEKIATDFNCKNELGDIWKLMIAHTEVLYAKRPYVRSHLQTRFFETGDNFYLGMEFNREYDIWKVNVVSSLMAPILADNTVLPKKKDKASIGKLEFTLKHYIDRLWYDACLETIRLGDVYNPGGKSRVPRLYFLDSLHDKELKSLPVGEAFRVTEDPGPRYEVLEQGVLNVVVRDVEGFIFKMSPSTKVRRSNNLTRKPDGNHESAVSIATFPVGHYVNHRTMRLNDSTRGYVFTFCGDEQSTPHFMRYSGLTGAAINSMLFNNFLVGAIGNIPFIDRYRAYSQETTWSNGEVVQRGTGANYGQDGFLAPGFNYKKGLSYLAARVVEFSETGQDLSSIMARDWNSNPVLSRDWMIKFASAFVPRGMENNTDYIESLFDKIEEAIFDILVENVEKDKNMKQPNIGEILRAHNEALNESGVDNSDPEVFWQEFLNKLDVSEDCKDVLSEHIFVAKRLEISVRQIIELSQKRFRNNLRISSQLENQPKSTDALIDDFAVEAQIFTNSFTQVASLSAISLALQFITPIGSAITSAISAWIAVGTITNVSRYKNRNEEWRTIFADKRYMHVLKRVYDCLSTADRLRVSTQKNPYWMILESLKKKFVYDVEYYNYPHPSQFLSAYDTFVEKIHDPDAIKRFMNILTTQLMTDTYQVNFYLKEDLVKIYHICEELFRAESSKVTVTDNVSGSALAVLERLILFKPRMETSLQRGEVKVGAFRDVKWKHGHWGALLQYIYSTFYFARTRVRGGFCGLPRNVEESVKAAGSSFKPVAVETLEITEQMRTLGKILPRPAYLSREVMDFESMYHAARESHVSSLVILSAWLSLITGIVFTFANVALAADDRLLWAQRLVLAASFSFGIITPISSVLSFFFLIRKFRYIIKCDTAVGRKMRQSRDDVAVSHLRRVKWVAHIQEFVTFLRILGSAASAVALPWALASSQGLWNNRQIPLIIAAASAGLQLFSVMMLFIVEYSVLWNLDPKLGEYVCVAFDDELKQLKNDVTIETNSVQTKQVQERASWEYVARGFLHRYRFDTIFAANRFGNVMQYIHSGLSKRSVDEYAITGKPTNNV